MFSIKRCNNSGDVFSDLCCQWNFSTVWTPCQWSKVRAEGKKNLKRQKNFDKKKKNFSCRNNFTWMFFCWHTSSRDKGSGVLQWQIAVSNTGDSKHWWLPRKHPVMKRAKTDNQSFVSIKQMGKKTRLCIFVFTHLAEVILISCCGREGQSFWTLIGCFRLVEHRGDCLVCLVLSSLGLIAGSTYERTTMEKHINWLTSTHIVHQHHIHK